ncbi:alanyl-tRNA synthetase [Caldicoprobacter guelmensis]|uniref:alanine--tRNA ligase n=1 Tax=Caldicoprobacter guelmensis TaxID=1170224 RepID=UPI00195C5B90|nr:alanine--tRNA ligase [Caldicoprobacter guelmensis]MBM7581368.1 alanyl-tRNA synthetase [Caldicoprobacter guelmensis]
MEKLGLNEIRTRFLEFFRGKDHLILPSFSLIPQKDKSLLLINAGMAPLKPYFTGQEKPPKKRIATCQKCIRTPDIERVGKTARHATFFEMLGNFSFGDYFKKEAIEWAWEFVTQDLKLPEDRLWASIYEQDDEAFEIWHRVVGLPEHKIVRMGKEDNFWEIGTGPCGPCSEIYFDRGPDKGCGKPDCRPGCDCDRFVEFWNLVFTQFNKDEEGNYHPLPHPNIDTGMGLERIAAIMQGVDSIFEVDTIRSILDHISQIAGIEYGESYKTDVSLRVITDHIRSTTFMVGDGILPSNEGRGYVLRRILRRAARHGRLLGIEGPFLSRLAKTVISQSCNAYPELKEREEYILKVIEIEEERFRETIDQGLAYLREYMDELKEQGQKVLDGVKAFKLYDTYGFPLDLTKEILQEEGLEVDEEGFRREMEVQRERARAAHRITDYMGMDSNVYKLIDAEVSTRFVGYHALESHSRVLAIIKDDTRVQSAAQGDEIAVVLDQSPFYAESGGQVADQGLLLWDNGRMEIRDVKKLFGNKIIHYGRMIEGTLEQGDVVHAVVDREARLAAARNHTATHLLHSALREVLGPHVEQAGSLVTPQRLRFDFSHFSALSSEEILKVERLVNQKIMEAIPVEVFETTFDEAKEMRAIALFGEKYGDRVRVVKIGDFSIELCGGTHLTNTGQAGMFKIVSESGVAAGVRRVEAITGFEVYNHILNQDRLIGYVCRELKTNPFDLEGRVQGLIAQIKEQEREIANLRAKLASSLVDSLIEAGQEIGGIKCIAANVEGQDIEGLRHMMDVMKDKMRVGVVVLATASDGKVHFVAGATKDAVAKGVHVGNLLREVAKITGGGGGGRPDMAQAGGKDASKLQEALSQVCVLLAKQLGIK